MGERIKRYVVLSALFSLLNCAFEEPYFITIEAGVHSERIIINNKFAGISDIPKAVLIKKKDLDALQRSNFFVKLKFEKETSKGLMSDIEYELRKLGVLNVKYYEKDEKSHNYMR